MSNNWLIAALTVISKYVCLLGITLIWLQFFFYGAAFAQAYHLHLR